jgi:hypothetical protein
VMGVTRSLLSNEDELKCPLVSALLGPEEEPEHRITLPILS